MAVPESSKAACRTIQEYDQITGAIVFATEYEPILATEGHRLIQMAFNLTYALPNSTEQDATAALRTLSQHILRQLREQKQQPIYTARAIEGSADIDVDYMQEDSLLNPYAAFDNSTEGQQSSLAGRIALPAHAGDTLLNWQDTMTLVSMPMTAGPTESVVLPEQASGVDHEPHRGMRPVPFQDNATNSRDPAALARAVELGNTIAEAIERGGQEFFKHSASRTSWVAEIQHLYSRMGRMTLDQLYYAHSSIAEGFLRQSRRSSLIRCLLMVVISKRAGRPSLSQTSSHSETSQSDERLRRYLAGTGRLFIDLMNRVSDKQGIKAYNIYTALFFAPENTFSFNMAKLRRYQSKYSAEIIAQACNSLEQAGEAAWLKIPTACAFDPSRAITATDLDFEKARQILKITAPHLPVGSSLTSARHCASSSGGHAIDMSPDGFSTFFPLDDPTECISTRTETEGPFHSTFAEWADDF